MLWDESDPDYENSIKKNQQWKELSSSLDYQGNIPLHKYFSILRSTYSNPNVVFKNTSREDTENISKLIATMDLFECRRKPDSLPLYATFRQKVMIDREFKRSLKVEAKIRKKIIQKERDKKRILLKRVEREKREQKEIKAGKQQTPVDLHRKLYGFLF